MAGIIGFFVLLANAIIISSTKDAMYTGAITQAPHRDSAIIFAGGATSGGFPSPMAADRVDRGIELYNAGIVKTLVMTGDDGAFRIEEVDAMRRYAEARGVSSAAIVLDPHGYRTYDSCYRAKRVYGLDHVIAVSQSFHLPRIIYLCRHLGVEAVGIPSEFRVSSWVTVKVLAREVFARVKGWMDTNLWPPRLRYFN